MSSDKKTSYDLERFVRSIKDRDFQGDIGSLYAERLIAATDNSIYQQMPHLVVYPKHGEDISLLVQAASDTRIPLSPRGGGTGTNAQSLTDGVMVDVTRYMDQIIDFDLETLTVRVQPGVILSRLNAFLKPYGFFFPPMVSTATRATIGGMIATDASGKGSRLYGKTSDYVVELDTILSDGSHFTAKSFDEAEQGVLFGGGSLASHACQKIHQTVCDYKDEIERIFPKMNRGLTGYNLKNIVLPDGSFNPIRVLAGSEGTLAVTKEVVLRVKKEPAYKRLLVVRYDSFDAALQHINHLILSDPLAIEILDDRLLETARDDESWAYIKQALGEHTASTVRGMNFVEFVGDDKDELQKHLEKAQALIDAPGVVDSNIIYESDTIAHLWDLRAKAVGLLGRPQGLKQGVPFVEDTAVPPEKLPAYTQDFRRILDAHGLDYGMFGHADVGCLHVRPFLNMHDKNDQQKIRTITSDVADLTHRYGGLLWGEHGRGVRGEFSPLFFGETLFSELCAIKAAFDPDDILNRGKLTPVGKHHVLKIDEIPFRGSYDTQISSDCKEGYKEALHCNGNGACFNQEPQTVMCPSYKGTKDRLQSPKGRAALFREWLRLSSIGETHTKEYRSLLKSLKESLATCLACKACSSQCPIRIDIPSLRSRFYAEYYRYRLRPLRDYLIFALEPLLKVGRYWPKSMNFLMHNPLSTLLLKWVGLVDLPFFSPAPLPQDAFVTRHWLNETTARKVVILQDSFVGSFDGELVSDAYYVFKKLGFDVRISPIWQNGKARHVKGFHASFSRTAKKIIHNVSAISQKNIPVVSLDPATGHMFGQEYRDMMGGERLNIQTPEGFLQEHLNESFPFPQRTFHLISHCSNQSLNPKSGLLWSHVMSLFGITLVQKKVGCCGMAGLFGHEQRNALLSKKIFSGNWQKIVDETTLVEGFSCRCQSERMMNYKPLHPVQLLYKLIVSG